ncbi:MAG TPA: RsmD family RNA methyltransferase, partial [Solirubrobacterales bacterium]|nr:RsmD family RNA methyltransferase [Solirubrobacterales bacterium]
WIANVPDGSFDLVFLDPPYRDVTRIAGELDPHLARILAPGGRVIAESDRRGPLEFPSLETVRERRYGRTVVTFHRVPSQPPQDPTGTE